MKKTYLTPVVISTNACKTLDGWVKTPVIESARSTSIECGFGL